jgi:hypothetical protein
MLDYAHQRAIEVLKIPRKAVLATTGPAGLQVSELPCEALELDLYLLVPQTSDHLFNLENVATVSLLTDIWDLNGEAQILLPSSINLKLDMVRGPEAQWGVLVRVRPSKLQIRKEDGWGNLETIDIQSQ